MPCIPADVPYRLFFFFFQAEDGIRDVAVTGVQTCALPISHLHALDGRDRRHFFPHWPGQYFAARNLGPTSPRHHPGNQRCLRSNLCLLGWPHRHLVPRAHPWPRRRSSETSRKTLGGCMVYHRDPLPNSKFQRWNSVFLSMVLLFAGAPLESQEQTRSFDMVITNGRIIDGTGSPWYSADVGIRNGKIASIGNLSAAPRARTI